MDKLERFMTGLGRVLGTNRKRHIIVGILMSASILMIGLAITVATIKSEDLI